MFWNKRATRVSVGLLLLGAAGVALMPSLTGYTSLDGTVNARLTVIAAPIDGMVWSAPPKVGTPLSDKQALVSIRNERVNRAILASLESELSTARDRVNALRREREELIQLRDELARRLDAYRAATLSKLERELAVLRKRIEVAEAQKAAAQTELIRRQTLGKTGIVAASAVEQAHAADIVSLRQIEIEALSAEQLEKKIEAVQSGIFIGDGQNDVPYSRQRQDEVIVRIGDLDTRIAENERRVAQSWKQLAEEEQRVRSLESATLSSPFAGVVWRNNVVSGSNVVVGNELTRLLDCSDLFVDILVPEVNYDEIYPGRDAEVRLLGRGDSIPGKVLSVRGNAAVVEETTLAAAQPKAEGRNARIRVALEPTDLNTDFQNFCHVGRSVQVRFETRSIPWRQWVSSIWFSIS
ncbi:HlyD family secretion protein [Microvirga sp. G4-2]|uniref:HlyD family secretion protein n=1 Tax=Microvirga sp. G4-2 TaxID=3434467 RepID=UPI004043B57C